MLVLYDVDTQNDFMNSDGALPVPGAESIKPALKRIMQTANEKNLPIRGSADRHFGTPQYRNAEAELLRNGGPFPNHCMDGTYGQKKIPETLLSKTIYIPGEKLESRKIAGFMSLYPQVIFEKQSYDVFPSPTNPGGNANLETALGLSNVTEVILYGVATDFCVKAAAIGMNGRDIDVYVIKDAIKPITPEGERSAFAEMQKAGANLITLEDFEAML